MIAHDGKRIHVGFAEHEILWLRAAMENGCKASDLKDLCEMTGRDIATLWTKIYRLRAEDRRARDRAEREQALKQRVSVKKSDEPIKAPAQAQLMSGSTRVRTYNAWSA